MMTPARLDQLTRQMTDPIFCGDAIHRELLDALTAERSCVESVRIAASEWMDEWACTSADRAFRDALAMAGLVGCAE